MGMLRFDHVGVVVDDLDAVAAFFLSLGFERAGGTLVEGETVDKINGLDGVRADASGTSASRSRISTGSSTDSDGRALTRSARSRTTGTSIGSATSAGLKG